MALTIAVVTRRPTRQGKEIIADVTFDSSYPTGGESLLPADLRVKRIEHIGSELASTGHVTRYDYATSKLMAFYGNYDAADGPLIEVPNATNLATATARLRIVADHFAAAKK